jgi:pimeloyl-ACP methyl ester carboxylesterase
LSNKRDLLVEYTNSLIEPTPPVKSIEEGLLPTTPSTPSQTLSSASVREMLKKNQKKQHEKAQEGPQPSEIIEETLIPGNQEVLSSPLLAGTFSSPPITNQIIELAESATEKILRDAEITLAEQEIFEAIVLPGKRPVLDIINGDFTETPADWEFLNDYRQNILDTLPSIGRIDIPELVTIPYGGTGFMVGKNVLMTNRHVAKLFVQGVGKGSKYVTFQSQMNPHFNTKLEVGEQSEVGEDFKFRIVKPLLIHPHWDAAFFQVEPPEGSKLPPPLKLKTSSSAFDGGEIQHIFVVGYPMFDQRNDVNEQMNIFRRIFGRKRLMPGYLNGYRDVRTKWNALLHATKHDASTLGGNSGSAIINLLTGEVLSLHFAGEYLVSNYGVPTWELAKDPHVNNADMELNFVDEPIIGLAAVPPEPPIWLDSWKDLASLLPENIISNEVTGGNNGGNIVLSDETPLQPAVPDWFEQTSDTTLVESMRCEPEITKNLIRKTLLPDEAEDLINDLNKIISRDAPTETIEEGIFDSLLGSSKTDPSLPEIIFLHGIMGGHLATREGFGGRVWLSALGFLAGDVAFKMSLADDGENDLVPNQTLYPDGHIRMVYEKAARKWRMDGFIVHEFSFDWRKSISNSADRLHFFIESLRLERPTKKFALVGHSMGGLVAAIYTSRHPEWSAKISQSIFLGTPFRGSYIPIEALLGSYPLLSKFALIDRSNTLDTYMDMARTLPGLLEMLPDPNVFPDSAGLYERHNWRHKQIIPSQMWLDLSRRLKQLLATSPILENAHLIVSPNHPTIGEASFANDDVTLGKRNRRGDGTVPLQSAAAVGASTSNIYSATYGHGDLPREPEVIKAVADILKDGRCDLNKLGQAEINDTSLIEEAPTEAIEEATGADLKLRLGNGILTQRDIDYLLRADHSTFPGKIQ